MNNAVLNFIKFIKSKGGRALKMENKAKAKKKSVLKIFIGIIAIILACILLLIGVSGVIFESSPGEKPDKESITNPYITTDKAMVSAHRSGADIAPENTMAAFEYCIESENFDIEIFEFDLHITKDGKLILLHDSTLDRTTDSVEVFGAEKVRPSEKTYEELRQLNFGINFCDKNGEYPYKDIKGEDVPEELRAVLLEDVLDYLEANGGFDYIIEIKDSGELGFKAADELYRVLEEKELLDKAVIGTFNGEVTDYIDEKYPDMMRSSSIVETVVFYFGAAFNLPLPEGFLEFEALQVPASGYGIFKLASERFINYAHRNNIAVQYWTVNDPDDVKVLNELGADCIMSDKPDMAHDVING